MRHPKASEEKRQSFQQKVNTYQQQTKPIIYIDESGFAHDMPRTHGYTLKGKDVLGIIIGMLEDVPMLLVHYLLEPC